MQIFKYIKNILIAIDQLANAILGGDPDETISSRLGKNYDGSWMERLVNKIFNKQKDHCSESIEHDEGGNALIK
jgi:hypothetical protein